MGGTRSPGYLGTALRELNAVLPDSRIVTLPRLGHFGSRNDAKPEAVAQVLREFLTAT